MKLAETMAQHPLILFGDFRKFFLGRIISAVGDKFFTIALAWWVVSHGGVNSKFHLGMLMAINVLGVVLFSPWMGVLADKLDKKYCMMAADAGRFLILAMLTYLLYCGQLNLLLLYFSCFAIAAFVPLFESASNSSLVLLTDVQSLPGAVAVNSAVLQLSNVLGSAVGGIVLASIGILGAFGGNSLSFLLSFCFIAAINANLKPSSLSSTKNQGENMREGWSYLRSNPAIGALLLTFCASNFFIAPLMLFIPMVVKFLLHYSVSWVAMLEGSLAFGALTATLILSCFPRLNSGNIYQKLFSSGVIMGAMVLVMAWIPSGVMISLALFLLGFSMGWAGTVVQAAFQQIVPIEMKGRFFSLSGAACFAILPLAFFLNGLVTQYFSLPAVIAANGLALIMVSLAFLFIPRVSELV